MSDYEAAVHLLRHPAIRDRLSEHVTWPQAGPEGWGGINWEAIREAADGTFSDGELMIVNAALALFTGHSRPLAGTEEMHSPTLPHLLRWLDDPSLERVLQAIQLKRGGDGRLSAGRIYIGRSLAGDAPRTGMAWVIGPDGIGEELTLHTQSGANGPKSPDGHGWGYGGSGAAQLALDILWDLTDREPHPQMFQEFKTKVLAPIDRDSWAIPEARLLLWLDDYEGERFVG